MIEPRPPCKTDSPVGAIELELLEHRIRIASDDRPVLGNLARCFDVTFDDDAADNGRPAPDLCIDLVPAAPPDADRLQVTSDPPDSLPGCGSVNADQPVPLVSAVNLWAVAESRRFYVFHAGAVARSGRAILLPAASHGGKSTLTATLLRRGFELLSDEVGAIDAGSGRLTPYRRALWLRPGSLAVLGLSASRRSALGYGHHVIGLAEIGARRAAEPALPALIVFPSYRAGEPTRLERLRPGQAVVALMSSACSQKRFKVRGLDLVIDLARRLPCYRLVYSAAPEAAAAIERAFEDAG